MPLEEEDEPRMELGVPDWEGSEVELNGVSVGNSDLKTRVTVWGREALPPLMSAAASVVVELSVVVEDAEDAEEESSSSSSFHMGLSAPDEGEYEKS